MRSQRTSLGGITCLSALLLALASCGEGSSPDRESAGERAYHDGAPLPSIVLITVDTLRREHLGCYGYPRNTSPVIDALAEESVVFEHALATMATTLPSHLSVMTGLYAHQHGRTSNKQGVENPFASGAGVSSIAKALAGEGFRTAAFVSSRVLDVRTGISDGFETFHCPVPDRNPAMADDTTAQALAWLETHGASADPLFLWLHLWDTHEPNEPPADLLRRFERDETVDRWLGDRDMDLELLSEKFREHDRIWEHFLGVPPPAEGEERGPRNIDLERLGDLVARYDADLFHVDQHLGRVIERLKALGIWDRSIVVFTADHGQSLGEHGVFGHGKILNVNTFVPLMLRFPPDLREDSSAIGRPRRLEPLVSLIDVLPTLMARMPPEFLTDFRRQLQGEDVLAADFSREFALTQEATSFRRREGSALRVALLTERWKYLYDMEAPHELFDLDGAGEAVDVLERHPDVARRLAQLTEELIARRVDVSSGETASEAEVEELLQSLKDLGYVDE